MRKEYSFAKARRNPYAKKLKKQVTIRLDEQTIGYFKGMAEDSGLTYQNLINLFLQDCVKNKKKLKITWK